MQLNTKIAILGANGTLGADLVKFSGEDFEVFPITRDTYQENKEKEFDVFINANGNSRRFWANNNVLEDFKASTLSVYNSILDFKFKKYIYISSSDVYEDHSCPKTTTEDQIINGNNLCAYGFHKYLSEQIVKNNIDDYLILRSCLILGSKLKKGPIYDILNNNPLFIKQDTQLQMITTKEITNVIKKLLELDIKNEIFNMGGRGIVDFREINKFIDKKLNISDEARKQIYEMNVEKLNKIEPLKRSQEYLQELLLNL